MLAAIRTHLLQAGAVTDGYAGVEVIARAETMLLVFRWRRDPNVYAIEVDYPRSPESPMTGEPAESADEWAQHLGWHLSEELGTGLVHRARRTLRDGRVLLDVDNAPDVGPPGFHIDSVQFDDDDHRGRSPGRRRFGQLRQEVTNTFWVAWNCLFRRRLYGVSLTVPPEPAGESAPELWLTEPAMDDTIPRRLLAAGRLACWVRTYSEHGGVFVGQAAASWEDDERTTARVEVLYTLPGVPSEVRHALARHMIVEAAGGGALRVVTFIDDPVLPRLGFRSSGAGEFTVGTAHE
ncbi:hypothetical protein SAMN05421678_103178 [Actinopolymorpha cephalotaxi]|uniref:Uncharacterized protein n=1 Tax=Actinopolymorpha cephalotaxi TaxID=504797 RepID=A0A1I2N892_9ACTN|nr:hypothetical protein SAMN05421678_103178 [Actinopolymorpha cephalotaxi]